LTLTELPQHPQPLSLRLPPLPGMLAQHYGQAQRARQRRVMIADHPDQNLRALEVMDNTIDRMILACSLYGSEASDYFDAQLAAAKPGTPALAASVFMRLALAVHFTQQLRKVMLCSNTG
jgi:hypothetical protein